MTLYNNCEIILIGIGVYGDIRFVKRGKMDLSGPDYDSQILLL